MLPLDGLSLIQESEQGGGGGGEGETAAGGRREELEAWNACQSRPPSSSCSQLLCPVLTAPEKGNKERLREQAGTCAAHS